MVISSPGWTTVQETMSQWSGVRPAAKSGIAPSEQAHLNVAPRKVHKEGACDVRFVDVDRSNADIPVRADVVAETRPLRTRRQGVSQESKHRTRESGKSTAHIAEAERVDGKERLCPRVFRLVWLNEWLFLHLPFCFRASLGAGTAVRARRLSIDWWSLFGKLLRLARRQEALDVFEHCASNPSQHRNCSRPPPLVLLRSAYPSMRRGQRCSCGECASRRCCGCKNA